MKLITNFAMILILGLVVISCGGGTTTPETSTDSTAVTQTIQTQPTAPTKVELVFNSFGEDEYGNPHNEIVLKVDGKEQKIDTILSCDLIPATDYERFGIPATAVSACGGWWAGAGDYFYAIIENNQAVVYQGWQAEEQEDEGYHWEQVNLNK